MRIEFAPPAKRFLNSQSNQVRSKLINDVTWIRDYPFLTPDDPRKVPFRVSPFGVLPLYQDDFHWIVYYLGDAEITEYVGGPDLIIVNIGDWTDEPSVYRQP